MIKYVTGPRGQVEAYERLCRKAAGLPSKGVHVGGGIHVTIPDAPPGPGWTTSWATIQEHPKQLDLCACPLFRGAPSKKLSVAEVQTLRDAEETAVELDETWVAVARAEPKGKP